ncbi:NAD(P)H-dependent flavin oxidoreductase [Hymenobacter glacialis]|uniref:NAD(P)H-dependent flavin oxidoreductase n=1 Tax=Hymenobacter glacialis TaxID=1908236 RepID=UPI0009F2386B|nr:nitronate monooxygenase [Hymenobacter glacialis]
MQTALTKLLNIDFPIIQAPIGSATTPELAASVSNAGGLGMLALSWTDIATTREKIRETKRLTNKPFGVNLILEWEQSERVEICIQEQVPVVSFAWGNSLPFLQALKSKGIKVCQTVSTSEEALFFENLGLDFLVAQGWEAGGHVLGKVASSVLVPSIADKIKIPFASAGGFTEGRGLLAALSLGASGIWIGTRFLMAKKANASSVYQELIAKANENDTVYAERLFNIGWDNAPHRVIRNSTVINWENSGKPSIGQRPNEHEIIAQKQSGETIKRYADDIPTKTTTGNLEALALYAGQSVGLIGQTIKTAKEIITEIIEEANLQLDKLHSLRAK